jgi:hypothetical protein
MPLEGIPPLHEWQMFSAPNELPVVGVHPDALSG